MKIAILTSGIMPVPAVQGGAVETLIDHYLEYNDLHKLHDITVYSVFHPLAAEHQALKSDVNHYHFVDTASPVAKVRKWLHGKLNRHTYYHYSIDYFFRQAMREIIRQQFDIIILENRPGYALGLRGKTKARLVYHLHNDFLNSTTPHADEIYRAASRIVTVSDFIKDRVQTCNPQDAKTITVLNGISLESATPATAEVSREALGFRPDDFILSFCGRLIPEKGVLELVEAMRKLAGHPEVKLLVMGSSFYGNAGVESPFMTRLKALALGLEDRIKFTGYVKHHLMPSYLRLSDVAVVPSTWQEPFGLTVLEGMAAGLPIITTDRGGIPEIVSADNAVVVPVTPDGNLADDLAKAVVSLIDNPEKRSAMGRASQLMAEHFSKEAYAKNFFASL
ncbi:MAG: glycosyltransferase family 4 protein [Prevotella sp.]|nr:glycosyltransferase family 4 protein [Prevotella sp.]